MGIPVKQQISVGLYILKQKLYGIQRYPLVLMLEPLFRCNLACSGCGKIDYPDEILNQRLSVEDCVQAAEECGTPIVSIAGGEPLIHKQMPEIVAALTGRKKFVYLCSNALLLKKHIDDYSPSPYLTFSIHLDGNRDRHDASVSQPGVFDQAIETIRLALSKGFRVTVNSTFFQGETALEVAEFFDLVTELGIEGITMSPGFSYEHAPQQDVFLEHQASTQLFRNLFKLQRSRKRKWQFNHSSLFLDFLAGNQSYRCTAWGNPTRNVFGWQRPCYLLADAGYAENFNELMETTRWDDYGTGRNPKCGNCMAHCGYEPTAVNDTVAHPLKALGVFLRGPRTDGPLAPPPDVGKSGTHRVIPIAIENKDRQPDP
ncbi:MAG: adenosyl-hopene transferase HpnH [Mariprofundaceae bacterium]